jgi:hypothetical protein
MYFEEATIRILTRLALGSTQLYDSRLGSTTDPIPLPYPKPRAVREHLVVPSIGSRDVACAERSNVRRFEHFLQLLDIVNDAFNVHSVSISNKRAATVKRRRASGGDQALEIKRIRLAGFSEGIGRRA